MCMQCGHMSMCECGCVHAMECVLSEDTFPVSPRLELSWLGSPSKRFYPLSQLTGPIAPLPSCDIISIIYLCTG